VALVFVQRGTLTTRVEGDERSAGAGEVLLVLPGPRCRIRTSATEETELSWLDLRFAEIGADLAEQLRRAPNALPARPDLSLPLAVATELLVRPLTTGRHVLRAVALALLWAYLGEAERGDARTTEPSTPVGAALRHMRAHLAEPVTLADLARAACVSAGHLTRLFRRELGETPVQHLWSQRVDAGVRLLRETALPVAGIAETCGFQSQFHFSRRVREATGLPPRVLRARTRGGLSTWLLDPS
jgi:AraC family transcriptional regulator of arabinose operon